MSVQLSAIANTRPHATLFVDLPYLLQRKLSARRSEERDRREGGRRARLWEGRKRRALSVGVYFCTVKVAAEAGKRGHTSFNLRMGSADFGNVMLMEGVTCVTEMMGLRNGFIPESIYTYHVT
ncbi:hypothetical protein D9758_015828 [Tetrapyrgos nigripes]|uniref:Uncharacterized protein n=1 Tax=Tetrapyrgos nigripes TaxID=182062 RepID=A0A8H5CF06_9AGAR|nr:hypothetical protein D9758_015828 [Tetrapyrgos nigripes]